MEKIDIKSLTLDQMNEAFSALGLRSFVSGQVFSWLHQKGVDDFSLMTNIKKETRTLLDEHFEIKTCKIKRRLVSKIDGTTKYLFELNDKELIESVVMKYKYGYTICVSSQVGCKMGCNFCASGIAGFKRNLFASEILSQVYVAQNDLDITISHIVLMGVGEPLDNFDNVMRFLELVTAKEGKFLSMRNISLSTCGIVPKIKQLEEKNLGLTLSVSLHAPNDKIRNQTMPISKRFSIEELLSACREYAEKTHRRVSFEYAMIKGVNDSDACAHELGQRLKGMLCHVNLIPVNSVKERSYEKSDAERIKRFIEILATYKITATKRRTLGSDINASCGQLRRGEIEE